MPLPLLPFASALLLYLATPGPGLALLAPVALVPLIIFCKRASAKVALLWGLAAGTLYHLLLIYWVTISMETYGGLTPLISWPALGLLALYMALYMALFCLLLAWGTNTIALLWLAPCLWVGLDFLRGVVLTGFPWLDLGYTLADFPFLIQAADIAGHHGITFLLVLTSALIAQLVVDRAWCGRHHLQVTAAVLLIIAALGYSALRWPQVNREAAQAPQLSVAVIQANIDQAKKWHPDHKKPNLDRHLRLTRQARRQNQAELVIWPETALAFYPSHSPLMAYVRQQTVAGADYSLLAGAPYVQRLNNTVHYYNSALLLSPHNKPAVYFKQHLVPFGEYIPLRSILPIPRPIVESLGDFAAGTSAAPLAMARAKIGALICIEAIYPDLARREVAAGATLLANITNDAWFGRSSAPHQHLAMAIFRSVENRRSMARAANTGISALIMPSGELLSKSGLFSPTALTGSLPLLSSATFFGRFGHFFPHLCLLASLTLLGRAWKKGRLQVK